MRWKKVLFKEKLVWALVDDEGKITQQDGLAKIRYQTFEGAKIYKASYTNLRFMPNSIPEELPDGVEEKAKDPRIQAGKSRLRSEEGFGSAGTRTTAQANQARKTARAFIDSLPEDAIIIYTDGACTNNPGPAGSAAVLHSKELILEAGRYLGEGTNQRAELYAIILAFELLGKAQVGEQPVFILTDSRYAEGMATKNWKIRANQDLVKPLRKLIEENPNARIEWVAGHVGVEGNERADRIASWCANSLEDWPEIE